MVDPTNTDVVCWHVSSFAIQNSKFGILNNEQLHESTSYYLRLFRTTNNEQLNEMGGSRAVRGSASLRCFTLLRTKPLPSLPQTPNR